jgi:hypothetical protein
MIDRRFLVKAAFATVGMAIALPAFAFQPQAFDVKAFEAAQR